MAQMILTLAELAEACGARLRGDADFRVRGVATLEAAGPEQISFFANRKYKGQLKTTRAGAVILAPEFEADFSGPVLITEKPYLAFAKIAQLLNPLPKARPGVHPSAVVDLTADIDPEAEIGPQVVVGAHARIGRGVILGAGCIVGEGAEIGPDSLLHPRVTLAQGVRIGARAIIHSGAVIGSDGFGFANEGGRWLKIPQTGSVVVGDDVEIGANTTIDRGALEDTRIGNGVKLDNQIQVAHNVQIGDDCAMAGCVGIAGSAQIGQRCTVGGGAVILGHLQIVDDVHITAMTMVTSSINNPGVYSSGTPVQENREWHRNYVRFKQLDEMAKRLRTLEKKSTTTSGQ